jgi:cytochrome oxidase Cu insertion factor (SCO1/SenC/PrrC family)
MVNGQANLVKKGGLVTRRLILGFLLMIAMALVGGCLSAERPTATDTSMSALPPAPVADHPAPDFTLPDLAGDELRLSDFKGQAILVNFWTTW